jgi:hypothetical protein
MAKRNPRAAAPIADAVLETLPAVEQVEEIESLTDLRRAWAAVWRAIHRRQLSREEASLKLYGLQVGTPIFNAEEQARHNQDLERKVDRLAQAVYEANGQQTVAHFAVVPSEPAHMDGKPPQPGDHETQP